MKAQLNTNSDFASEPLHYEEEKTYAPAGEDKEDKAYICDKQCHKCKCLTKTNTL